ncbi:MAG: YheC/YheD family protein [Bacillota bacterium]
MSEVISQWQSPVVGIAIPPEWNHHLHEKPPTNSANMHMDAAEQLGVSTYFFALKDVQLEKRTIIGLVRVDGEWIRTPAPWPDVYYESAEMEALDGEMPIVEQLWSTAIMLNTTRRLGKWQCCDILRRYPDTQQYVPDTVAYTSPEDLATMLHKHKVVLVKPEYGKTGRGISRVSVGKNGRLTWEDSVTSQREVSLTLGQVLARIRQTAGTRKLAIQQAIPLLKVDGRLSDIRYSINKDGSGQWQFMFAALKIGKAGKFVTNVARGGTWVMFPEALSLLSEDPVRGEQLMAELRRATAAITRRLEQNVGPMGEFGYDLAFDPQYGLWFLEANPNPGKKNKFTRIQGQIPPWFTNVFEYARYLWQQQNS